MTNKSRHVAKNRKKYWKKHCNIEEVEEFLHAKNRKFPISDVLEKQPDEQLFALDGKKLKKSTRHKTATQRRKERIATARCYTSLELDPSIKPVSIPRTQPLKVGSQKYNKVKNIELRKLARTRQIQADIQRVAASVASTTRRNEAERLDTRGSDTNKFHSLWSAPDTYVPMVEEDFIEHAKKKPVKPPKHHFLKPSRLCAIEPPHPGTSYNPSYADHQNLLRKANTKEERKLNATKKWNKELMTFKKLPKAVLENRIMTEMTQGLFNDNRSDRDIKDDNPVSGDYDNNATRDSPVSSRITKRRTKAARQHELLEKKRIERLKKRKVLKKQQSDLCRLKAIKKEIEKQSTIQTEKLQRRSVIRKSRIDDPKILGINKFQPADIDVKLTTELVGSLRLVAPEGNLLTDRFKSFERRNMLRPTVKVKKTKRLKKNRPKIVEKRESKAISL